MKSTHNLTYVRILSLFTSFILLLPLSSCGQSNDPAQDTTLTTTTAMTTTTSAEQTVATTEVSKDPAEEVPFQGLQANETMKEFRYEYLEHGDHKLVFRYGVFSTTDEGYLNGTGLYWDILNEKMEYVTSYRYAGVGFIALKTESSVDPTLGVERTWTTISTFSLATYNGASVQGESKRLWYTGDTGVDVLDFVSTPTFTLDRYGERNFFQFTSHATQDLEKIKGARFLAYQDGTKSVLADPNGARVIDDALITSVENLTMKEVAERLGMEYKG